MFVLVALETGAAQLMVVQASDLTEEAWDEAVRFCWAAGWEPRQDDPDVYIRETDTEFYVLAEVTDEEMEEDYVDVRDSAIG